MTYCIPKTLFSKWFLERVWWERDTCSIYSNKIPGMSRYESTTNIASMCCLLAPEQTDRSRYTVTVKK